MKSKEIIFDLCRCIWSVHSLSKLYDASEKFSIAVIFVSYFNESFNKP